MTAYVVLSNLVTYQVTEWENVVKNEQEEKLDISADMVRQYKTMQSTMALRIHLLETNLAHMQVRIMAKLHRGVSTSKHDEFQTTKFPYCCALSAIDLTTFP